MDGGIKLTFSREDGDITVTVEDGLVVFDSSEWGGPVPLKPSEFVLIMQTFNVHTLALNKQVAKHQA